MKILFILSTVFALIICSSVIAQTIVEEEFIVGGEPVYTETAPSGPVVVTPGPTVVTTAPPPAVVVPAEQNVYLGMSGSHVKELYGLPTYVEKFRRFTRRHHGIYDEVWTYTAPPMVLYIKERRVQKIEYQ